MGPDDAYLQRCRARMAQIDALPADVRALIHEEGWTVVNAFLLLGVRKAKHIRHLIDTVRRGSEGYGNGRAGEHTENLIRELTARRKDLVVVPREPTPEMIEASMAAVAPYGRDPDQPWLSKYNKHKTRLRAALAQAGDARRAEPPQEAPSPTSTRSPEGMRPEESAG